MGKVIILEGPDGGGKTTLANALYAYGFVYKHEGPPPSERDQLEYYKITLYDALEAPYNVVFDRLHLGELIYGPIIRGIDKLGKESLKLFERVLASQQVRQYICMPSEAILRTNYLLKSQDPNDYVGGMGNFKKVINGYYALMLRPYTHVYDYEVDNINRILDDEPQESLPKGTIGSKEAKYLFIADVPNHLHVDWPFFSMDNSSGYFNKALEIAKIDENDLALSNAYGPNHMKHDPNEIIKSLPNLKKIILMGGKAQDWFSYSETKSHISVVYIQHPSYVKRFRGTNPEIFAEEIRRGLWHS